ncbi:MAG: Asp-tRNA(Asn)/Glu-tRNA(Gln) amidotransferase subunit GatA [Deltaproteobacteria bacterium]|nr:Asp-tRNA(Asn)/Glu-tRNA(Gln) amidotransferase subunit GatA [Deltaproteobacteria bacterium]
MSAPSDLPALALSEAYDRGELRPSDAVAACLESIERARPLNAYVKVDRERAVEKAKESDARLGHRRSILDGVPLALKDNIVTEGLETTAGSRILSGWIPPYSATVVRRLEQAGAIVLGKTNLDEFGMGSSSEHTPFGPVRNPWDVERVPGGSSGGSAVAVAARTVPLALGSDTGGSIRQPAHMCGVFGLKPTYGRVSRLGLVAYASSLDQIGPFARTAADLAAILEIIAGPDPLDSTTVDAAVPNFSRSVEAGVRGLRVGVPAEYLETEGKSALDPEVRAGVELGIEALERAGATTVRVSLPHTRYAIAAYYLVATAEASSNLSRFDGIRYGARVDGREYAEGVARTRHAGFGAEVKRRIALGTFVLSAGYYDAYYGKAQKVRTLVRRDFEAAFASCDLLATPVAPTAAFKLNEKLDDPLAMYLADAMTVGINLAGLPALSAPVAHTRTRLPVGVQLVAPWLEEGRLLRSARVIEELGAASAGPPSSG